MPTPGYQPRWSCVKVSGYINDDNRDFESFAEKGLSEKRQRLRYEHYEEKRQLKVKAI